MEALFCIQIISFTYPDRARKLSILPARVANNRARFGSSFPLTEQVTIVTIVTSQYSCARGFIGKKKRIACQYLLWNSASE